MEDDPGHQAGGDGVGMIDRVAEAMCCFQGCRRNKPGDLCLKRKDQARRAIEAMREPTLYMLKAGGMAGTDEDIPRWVGNVWKDMIDMALADDDEKST